MNLQLSRAAHWMSSGTHRLRRLVPASTYCVLCARPGQAGIDLCVSCQQQLKPTRHRDRCGQLSDLCTRCGQQIAASTVASSLSRPLTRTLDVHGAVDCAVPVTHAAHTSQSSGRPGVLCSECRGLGGQLFAHIVAPYRYAFPLDRLVKRIKYAGDRQLTRPLGRLLAAAVDTGGVDRNIQALIPMPLHHSRLSERGFNQAEDLARWCGAALGIAVCAEMAQRIESTGSLAGLNRQERRLRILGVFRAHESVAGKRVAIVDDVMTTGASAGELARELYDSGADAVELWVLARTSSVRAGV